MKRIADEGMEIPRGWGVAYRDVCRRQAICFPMPAHLIVGWARAIYYWIVFPPWTDVRRDRAFEQGYRDGYAEGSRKGRQILDELKILLERTLRK